MLKISDDYEAFCIDEAANYVYYAMQNNVKPSENGNSILNKHCGKK